MGAVGVPATLGYTGVSTGEVGIEYLWPTADHRDLHTVSANAVVGQRYARGYLSLHAGITVTHAFGTIRQLEGSFESGSLEEKTIPSDGFGAGPCFVFRVHVIPDSGTAADRSWDLAFEGSGAVIFYDRRFPAGGDHYNYMGRFGAVFGAPLGRGLVLMAKMQWMHVSNAQGLGPWNPAYEAFGPTLSISAPL
jgi:hypothetical protein